MNVSDMNGDQRKAELDLRKDVLADELFRQSRILAAAQELLDVIEPQRWGQFDGERLQGVACLKAQVDTATLAVLGAELGLKRLVEEEAGL